MGEEEVKMPLPSECESDSMRSLLLSVTIIIRVGEVYGCGKEFIY